MGLLGGKSKKNTARINVLPSGCITIDRNGGIVATTVSHSVQPAQIQHIVRVVTRALQGAHSADLSLTEIHMEYPALKIVARELKGGAIVFLTPRSLSKP